MAGHEDTEARLINRLRRADEAGENQARMHYAITGLHYKGIDVHYRMHYKGRDDCTTGTNERVGYGGSEGCSA